MNEYGALNKISLTDGLLPTEIQLELLMKVSYIIFY